jgi:hypothetical protein
MHTLGDLHHIFSSVAEVDYLFCRSGRWTAYSLYPWCCAFRNLITHLAWVPLEVINRQPGTYACTRCKLQSFGLGGDCDGGFASVSTG